MKENPFWGVGSLTVLVTFSLLACLLLAALAPGFGLLVDKIDPRPDGEGLCRGYDDNKSAVRSCQEAARLGLSFPLVYVAVYGGLPLTFLAMIWDARTWGREQ